MPSAGLSEQGAASQSSRGKALKRKFPSPSLGAKKQRIDQPPKTDIMPSPADFEVCLRVAEFGRRELNQEGVGVSVVEQGKDSYEVEDLLLFQQ